MISAFDESLTLSSPTLIKSEITRRSKSYVTESINPKLQEDYVQNGWEFDRKMKASIRMRRPKSHDVQFEDTIWSLFASLGFHTLNKGRDFKISYGKRLDERKQIDVFAMDDESIILVECKSATKPVSSSLKSEIETWIGIRTGLMNQLRQDFPDHKVKLVLATSQYSLSPVAITRLRENSIFHMDEGSCSYFRELQHQIGTAARYQLLGTILAGEKIPNLEGRVPALKGRMGGNTYYSFMIEPERLLKLSYILHNTLASEEDMQTYQRIVKRSRLNQISKFVDHGGFFPNSIIVNIDAGKRAPRFDLVGGDASLGIESAQLGILHLPHLYRSAYIIDGQHRLYGYSESRRASTELIPVVAFVDMDSADQVQMFMDINENQKAVSKTLRNILDADLLWNSSDLSKKSKSVRLRIAQRIADGNGSPLRGRVLLGEEPRDALRCISIESIQTGLNRGNLLSTYTKTRMTSAGTIDQGDPSSTVRHITRFLEGFFQKIAEGCATQYELGSAAGGFVFMNNGIEALLRIASDFVDHVARSQSNPEAVRNLTAAELLEECDLLIEKLVQHINSTDPSVARELRSDYGTGGKTRYWRELQSGVHDRITSFNPDGLQNYLDEKGGQYNSLAYDLLSRLEAHLKSDVRSRLEKEYEGNPKKGIPQPVFIKASNLAAEKNYTAEEGETFDIWDGLYLVDYQKIMTKNATQWREIFEAAYSIDSPGSQKWESKASWLETANKIRNKTMHNQQVSQEEFRTLEEICSRILPV